MSLFADRRAIKQIAINLLSNAVKFTGERGHISVRARNVAGRDGADHRGQWLRHPEGRARQARPAVRAGAEPVPKSHAGSGLGLAISRSLAELHGGALKIRSTKASARSCRCASRSDGRQGGLRVTPSHYEGGDSPAWSPPVDVAAASRNALGRALPRRPPLALRAISPSRTGLSHMEIPPRRLSFASPPLQHCVGGGMPADRKHDCSSSPLYAVGERKARRSRDAVRGESRMRLPSTRGPLCNCDVLLR